MLMVIEGWKIREEEGWGCAEENEVEWSGSLDAELGIVERALIVWFLKEDWGWDCHSTTSLWSNGYARFLARVVFYPASSYDRYGES